MNRKMNNKIPQKDMDLINKLMKERRNALHKEGHNSEIFIEVDKNFNALLNKYNLIHSEYTLGFMNKKN